MLRLLFTEYDKTRRCVYTDGDSEDLSIKELQKLELAEAKRQNKSERYVEKDRKYIFDCDKFGSSVRKLKFHEDLNEDRLIVKEEGVHNIEKDTKKMLKKWKANIMYHVNDAICRLEKEEEITDAKYTEGQIVTLEQKDDLAQLYYHLMKQVRFCTALGRCGFKCIHCLKSKSPKQFFDTAEMYNVYRSSHTIFEHLKKCTYCPSSVRKSLQVLKYYYQEYQHGQAMNRMRFWIFVREILWEQMQRYNNKNNTSNTKDNCNTSISSKNADQLVTPAILVEEDRSTKNNGITIEERYYFDDVFQDAKSVNSENFSIIIKEPFQAITDWQDLDEIDEFKKASTLLPPIEIATETSSSDKIWGDRNDPSNDSLSDEEWLTSVAKDLLLSKPPKEPNKKQDKQKEKIISKPAETKINIDEAKANIPPPHAPSIRGPDYCTIHADTSFLKTNTQLTTKRRHDVTDENNISPSHKKRKILFKSIATLKDDMSTFFKSCSPYVQNLLQWDIQCAEDAFCSERNAPFALGLLVRRYFPGYGTCVVTFDIICCYEYVLHI